MSLNQAVECAVDECIKEGILAEFLSKNRAEVISMSISGSFNCSMVLSFGKSRFTTFRKSRFMSFGKSGFMSGFFTIRKTGFILSLSPCCN